MRKKPAARKPRTAPRSYTIEDKLEAVAAYVLHGTTDKAAEITGFPRRSIDYWKTTSPGPEWWDLESSKIWEKLGADMQARYQRVIDLGTNAMIDRLQNGDTKVNTRGEKTVVPVSARDLVSVVGVAQDKLRLIQNKPTSIGAKDASLSGAEILKRLKQSFSTGDKLDLSTPAQGAPESRTEH